MKKQEVQIITVWNIKKVTVRSAKIEVMSHVEKQRKREVNERRERTVSETENSIEDNDCFSRKLFQGQQNNT